MSEDVPPQSQVEGTGTYRPFPSFAEWEPTGFNTDDFDRYADMLAKAKGSALAEVLEDAMIAARRYAAVDTNAIEGLYQVDRGFTRTVANQAAAWEVAMEARGPHVRPAFDDAIHGYEYVLDCATRKVEITELWIKELHSILTASQQTYTVCTDHGWEERPLAGGAYKTMPNSPTLPDGRTHAYAPVLDTIPEMERFIRELRSENFLSAHPVLQAAYAHYAYVCIHPFPDGNGRVARAFSSVFLYRSPGIPLVVFADQRNEYYDSLESADKGDSFLFVRFMMSRVIDTIGIVLSMLHRSSPPVASTLAELNKLFDSSSDVEAKHAAAIRLRNIAVAEAGTQVAKLQVPSQLKIIVWSSGAGPLPIYRTSQAPDIPGYQSVGNEAFWILHAESPWPRQISASLQMEAFIASSDVSPSDLILASRPDDVLEIWLREIVPIETETLKLKVSGWIEAKIAEFFAQINQLIKDGK